MVKFLVLIRRNERKQNKVSYGTSPETVFNSLYERYNESNHRMLCPNHLLSKINYYKFYFVKTFIKVDDVLQMLSYVVCTEATLYVFAKI